MVYVDPRPDESSLRHMYEDPNYFAEGYALGVETEGYFDRRDELVHHYEAVARELIAETGLHGAELLELGAAGGYFLEGARRAGLRVRGIELSPAAADYARRELYLDVFQGEIENAPYPLETFDLVYADNVLEHTRQPSQVLENLFRLTRPRGYLVAIVPTYVNSIYYRSLLALQNLIPARLLGSDLVRILKISPRDDGGPPYHILEFDDRAISTLIERAGFEIISKSGSTPLPAHLFKAERPTMRTYCLRTAFTIADRLMRIGLLPPARLRILARRRG